MTIERNPDYRRIATEEAYADAEVLAAYRKLIAAGSLDDPGFNRMWGVFLSDRPRTVQLVERLLDIGERRIADMDATGIDKAVLAVTAPGMQVFEAEEAKAMARRANDTLAAAVERYPDRYIGLSTVATQDPAWAAEEIRRGQQELGFRGVQINSHTKGEYLDHPKFDPILRACAETDQLLYIHPQSPPDRMIDPFLEAGLDGAVFGFGVEVGLHLLRIITSGVFDRYPNLQIGVGHMGEALPFWLYRINYMHLAGVRSKRYAFLKPLKKTIFDYMRENVVITTRGMAWAPAIKFTQQVIGVDRVLYAMDYPYQYEPDEVRTHDLLDISDEDKKKLMQTNAERVFKI